MMSKNYYLSLFLALFLSITSCAHPEQQSIIPTAANSIIETNTPTLVQDTHTPSPTVTITPAVINKTQIHSFAINENNIGNVENLAIFGVPSEFCTNTSLNTALGTRLLNGKYQYLLANDNPKNQTIEIWDLETEKIVQLINDFDATTFLFHPDQTTLMTLLETETTKLSLWDISSGEKRQEFEINKSRFFDDRYFRVSPDGITVALFSYRNFGVDFRITEFNLEQNKARNTDYFFSLYSEALTPFMYLPNGNLIAVTYNADEKLHLIDLSENTDRILQAPFENLNEMGAIPEVISIIEVNSGAKYLVGGSLYGSIYIWDFSSGNLLRKLNAHEIYISGGWVGGIKILQFSPESNLLLSVGYDGYIKLWDVSTGVLLKQIDPCHHFGGFTEDGRYLVAVGKNGIEVWGIP